MKKKWLVLVSLVLFLVACESWDSVSETSYQEDSYQTMDIAMEQPYVEDSVVREQSAGREIIYNATVNYQTVNYDAAKESINKIIDENDAFIQYQDESKNDYRYSEQDRTLTYLYMVIRVPQDKYEAVLSQFEANDQAQLIQLSQGSQDVTQQVQDIEIRIQSVDAQIERLNELNEQADTVTDLIEIQRALEEAITERDLLLAQQQSISDEVDYATINLSLQEVIELSDRSESQLTFWDRIMIAFENTWQNSVDAFQWGILTIIFLIPYIIVVLIIVLLVRYVLRPITKKVKAILRRNKNTENHKQSNSDENNTDTE